MIKGYHVRILKTKDGWNASAWKGKKLIAGSCAFYKTRKQILQAHGWGLLDSGYGLIMEQSEKFGESSFFPAFPRKFIYPSKIKRGK